MYTISQDNTGTWIASKSHMLLLGTGTTAVAALELLLRLEAEASYRYIRCQHINAVLYKHLPQLDNQTRETIARELNPL